MIQLFMVKGEGVSHSLSPKVKLVSWYFCFH